MKAKVNEVPKKYSINSSDLLPRKKLSSFERDASEEIDPNAFQLNPLSTKFYSDLLRLEEKVSSKNFDIETLNEIVSLYAKCVEYYDSVKDPIKYYFLEKIQITLANKASLKIMILKKNDEENSMRKHRPSRNHKKYDDHLDQINDEDSELEEDNNRERTKTLPAQTLLDRYSITRKRAERSKRLSLYMQLEEKKTDEFDNTNNLIETYENKTKNNDIIIKSDLKIQMESLKEKLERRKNASILKNSGYFDNSLLSASFCSDRINNSLFLEESNFNKKLKGQENNFLLDESKILQQSIEFKPHTIIKENTVLSPIKNKKIEQPQEQNIQPNDVVNKKIEQPQEKIIQPNDVVNKNQVSNLKNNENNDSSVKTPASRLKKSERKSAIQPFSSYEKKSSNEKRISTPSTNLNDILNKIQVFNTNLNSDSPPGSNKQLLHEKIKKNANLLLDAPEIQKKKNKRIFSISILEKVEELSKMDNLMQKE